MKEAVTNVIDTLTQEDFHGALQKLLERYNKCIAAGGDYFEGDEFHVCTINKSAHTKKSLETYCVHLVYIYIKLNIVFLVDCLSNGNPVHVDHTSAVKKSDHQKFVGGFALSGLLGLE